MVGRGYPRPTIRLFLHPPTAISERISPTFSPPPDIRHQVVTAANLAPAATRHHLTPAPRTRAARERTGCTSYARFTRGQRVETLHEDYIRTATSTGVPLRGVLFKHALRAAIVPVVTIFGLGFAFLLGGVIFIEQIFSLSVTVG
jgi:hypothetical protein